MKVGFCGLGVMGYPMAGHLANAGHEVTVYNRTQEKAAYWLQQYTGRHALSPADAAVDAEVVFVCVGNDQDLRSVVLGEQGILASLPEQGILVDHTTASATLARELETIACEARQGFLDAPVSGGQSGAEKGILSIMVGGDINTFNKMEPLLRCYGSTIRRIGDAGSGQLAKMVNQICIAGLLQGLSEALNFAQCSGIDAEKVLEVISGGAAQSWQMDNRGETMLTDSFDFGFAVDWMRKDLRLCLDQGNRIGAQLPVTALVDQFYARIQNQGGGRLDTSSLIRLLKQP